MSLYSTLPVFDTLDLVVSDVSNWISRSLHLAISLAHVTGERATAFRTDMETRLSAAIDGFLSPDVMKKKQQLELEIEWLEREKHDLVVETELLRTQQLTIAQEFWTTSFECTSPVTIACVDYACVGDEPRPSMTALLAEKEQQLFKLEVEKRELYDSVIRYAHELQVSVQQYEADIEQLNRNAHQLEDVAQQLLDKATGLQRKLSDSKAREMLAFNFIRAHLLPVTSTSISHDHEPEALTPTESEDSEVECCEC